MPLRLAILTISDASSRGERSDTSGDLIASWAKERGYTLADRALGARGGQAQVTRAV
jgi:molybdopterin biosynthesis enzyme MoaB